MPVGYGRKDSLEEEMATHSSILAWRIPWTEEPGWMQSMVSQKRWTRLKQLNTQALAVCFIHSSVCQSQSQGSFLSEYHQEGALCSQPVVSAQMAGGLG